jgi:putative aldouronate transport system substrate-binding protein
MKKGMRILSLMVSAAMLLAVFAACSAAPQPTQQPTAPPTEAAATEPAATVGPPTVLTVISASGGSPTFQTGDPMYDSNPVGKLIEQEINVKLNWVILTGDGNDQLQLKLASDDYGDIINKPSTQALNKMITDQMVVPLEGLIDQYGPNVKAAYGEPTLNFLKNDDGHLYFLTQNYTNISPDSKFDGNGPSILIRKDVYEAIGSPKMETLDDYYNALVAIKADAALSKNYNGDPTFPVSGFNRTWGNALQTLEAMGGSGTCKWVVDNGQVKYWYKAPWAKEVIKFYNKIYTEGLLDPAAFQQDSDTWWKEKLTTARALTHIGSWWQVYDGWSTLLQANVPGAENMYFLDFAVTVPGGDKPQLVGISAVGSGATVITDKCAAPDKAMALLNWLADPKNNFVAQNGVEGGIWDMQGDKAVLKPEFLKKFNEGAQDEEFSPDYGYRVYHDFVGTSIGRSPYGTFWILKDDPQVTGNVVFLQRDEKIGPYWFDSTPFSNIDVGIPDDVNQIYQTVEKKLNEDIYQAIMAKNTDEAMAEFDKFLSAMQQLGDEKVEAAVTANYQKNLTKLGE